MNPPLNKGRFETELFRLIVEEQKSRRCGYGQIALRLVRVANNMLWQLGKDYRYQATHKDIPEK